MTKKQSEETIQKRIQTRPENGDWQKDKDVISKLFSNGAKKRFSNPEERRKASERMKGKRWYTNGIESKQCFPKDKPEGFILGRLKLT